MNYVYLHNNNGALDTFFTKSALFSANLTESDCLCVPSDKYPGCAYIDSNNEIKLGPNPAIEAKKKLSRLKQYLEETDYVVIKIMEGVATKEDYADILEKRNEVRKQIQKLE